MAHLETHHQTCWRFWPVLLAPLFFSICSLLPRPFSQWKLTAGGKESFVERFGVAAYFRVTSGLAWERDTKRTWTPGKASCGACVVLDISSSIHKMKKDRDTGFVIFLWHAVFFFVCSGFVKCFSNNLLNLAKYEICWKQLEEWEVRLIPHPIAG